ncbi:MAG: hypothetical protein RLZZ517_309 [Candidatus Parcubacteria bacterium]|jgi:putative flippase GtrA
MSKFQSFIMFCTVGALSALIDLVFLYIGVDVLHVPLLISATVSFSFASINGYFLNQKLTFKKQGSASFFQYFKYLFVSVIGLLFTLILLHIFTNIFNIYYLISKMITIIVVVFWNYTANILWVFKK